ncbi:PadR family transcriptional regulator [Anaerorhabdus sp.]|uniref:PadR family transcriptional regulator n=1 Tax=Anaerorhabdus sp. TaxID=1872524 RepID=UPI002FCC371D
MNLEKKLPLTETTYYILISLLEPNHGYAVMQNAEQLSDGRVRIAAGTMYGALENLLKQNLIRTMPSPDPRRKIYQTTQEGKELLILESKRLKHMVSIFENVKEDI